MSQTAGQCWGGAGSFARRGTSNNVNDSGNSSQFYMFNEEGGFGPPFFDRLMLLSRISRSWWGGFQSYLEKSLTSGPPWIFRRRHRGGAQAPPPFRSFPLFARQVEIRTLCAHIDRHLGSTPQCRRLQCSERVQLIWLSFPANTAGTIVGE